jgi:hypothetical protein
VSVVCCQVGISATSWSFVQRSPTSLWCAVGCDLETSRMRRPWLALGRSAKKNIFGIRDFEEDDNDDY